MRSERVSNDFTNWGSKISNSRLNGAQTPKNKNKIQLGNGNTYQQNNMGNNNQYQKRSISPIHYNTASNNLNAHMNNNNDRVSLSPLRVPLQQAISRCVRDRSIDKSTSRRVLAKSSRRQQGSFIDNIKKISYQDQLQNRNVKAHSQTLKFIKKYFDINFIIPTEEFISKLLFQYGNLWDNQNLQQLLEDFTYKVNQIFGIDGIDPKALILKTKNDGMLGLIMNIFKELKEEQSTRNSNYTSFSRNPQVMSINKSFQERLNYNQNLQNIKNVVQQFMESMYQCMQTQIYNKFNIQMRRMVLKYREAQKIIKKVNQKITTHADFFDLQEKLRKHKKNYQEKISEQEKNYHKLEAQLNKEKQISNQLKNSKLKIQEQNKKLKQNMEKLQNALINKALENSGNTQVSCKDPSLSRRSTTPFADRTQQYTNTSNIMNPLNLSTQPVIEQQPFQIKIDTHFIQKDIGPPSTYTTTTFGNGGVNNPNSILPSYSPISPIKIKDQNKENNFVDSRYTYSPYQSRFTGTRLY